MFRYVLLDSSQHPRFHEKLERRQVLYRSLFEGHAEEALPDIAPLLIDATIDCEAMQTVIDETTRIGKLKPCVSMLESTLPLDRLAEHFTQFHLVETSNGRSMLMRWYDTRILPIWLDILTDAQRNFFTHPIAQWTSIDRVGTEQEHTSSKLGAETPIAGHTPLQLDERQVEQLFAAAEPDLLLYELRKTLSKQIDSIPHRVLYPFVHAHWQIARQHGLLDRNDQVQFLGLALYTSGHFVDHPIVTNWLARAPQAHKQDPDTWLNSLPDEVLSTGAPLWENRIDHEHELHHAKRSALP